MLNSMAEPVYVALVPLCIQYYPDAMINHYCGDLVLF